MALIKRRPKVQVLVPRVLHPGQKLEEPEDEAEVSDPLSRVIESRPC